MGRPRKPSGSKIYKNLSAALDDIENRQSLSPKKPGRFSNPDTFHEAHREYKRMVRSRAAAGGRQLSCDLGLEAAAASIYLQSAWGFLSASEAARVALRYLAIQTRKGLTRIDLDITQDPP